MATARLAEERKNFRKDRPFGFSAKPISKADGSMDMFRWECVVPGKADTYMEGGKYPVELTFPADFPSVPPRVKFPPGFLHCNVFDTGDVCLSILKTEMPAHQRHEKVDTWMPSISVRQILFSLQELLSNPNFNSYASPVAYNLYRSKGLAGYEKAMRDQVSKYSAEV
mmetsp:Transcript_16586/g.28452  ORF Transcript_16586/g.28452 Transcript_16586/m.28452 type:complete len:168 (+) Transcript_16586:284-787(+)|eukprot:CAMPEP_0119104236 /NCGR_PEP_ID=MMETSP1180-20130426/2499_1 /TAXON_ID=3052 ORGANISM="Chlamydomonas cf sp, Strain CCMP681" /NCGR_SAMPLE_ID=MMETSP1180 /ASSEMBLY_ACC=CAM_ASM_000741 /LENGTH=167 /DNA_ID=CAMNT_0007088933 /DNA_START=283 /DNA_END=786 /DNA_ORIENTATION=-